MNVGSTDAASLWMARSISAAASDGGTGDALTFRGRTIVRYARDGLPILEETPEERQKAIEHAIAAEAARGQDVSNPRFVTVAEPIRDRLLGPIIAYQQRTAMQIAPPKPISGPPPGLVLRPNILERIQEARANEPIHEKLDSIAGDNDATAEGSDRIYAAFFHRGGRPYATVDADGVVTIEGTAVYLTAALAGVEGAEARTAMIEKLIPPDKATRYSDAATAPTFDELWNPKPAGT